jgi:hypothetical protein
MANELATNGQAMPVARVYGDGDIMPARRDLSKEQLDLLKQQICPNASDVELDYFIAACNHLRLDPFAKQVYGIKRGGKLSIEPSIEGYFVIAERTGEVDGIEGPFWTADGEKWVDIWLRKEPPAGARVIIHRKGRTYPSVGTCAYEEYVQRDASGRPVGRWAVSPANQLACAAIRQAIKRGFQNVDEELRRAGIEPPDEDGATYQPVVSQAAEPAPKASLPAPEEKASVTESSRRDAMIDKLRPMYDKLSSERRAIAMEETRARFGSALAHRLTDAQLIEYGRMVKAMIEDPDYDPRQPKAEPPSEAVSAPPAHPAPASSSDAIGVAGTRCSVCGKEMTAAQHTLSTRKYGVALCPVCQKARKEVGTAAAAETDPVVEREAAEHFALSEGFGEDSSDVDPFSDEACATCGQKLTMVRREWLARNPEADYDCATCQGEKAAMAGQASMEMAGAAS